MSVEIWQYAEQMVEEMHLKIPATTGQPSRLFKVTGIVAI